MTEDTDDPVCAFNDQFITAAFESFRFPRWLTSNADDICIDIEHGFLSGRADALIIHNHIVLGRDGFDAALPRWKIDSECAPREEEIGAGSADVAIIDAEA